MIWHIVYLSYESQRGGRNYIGKHSTENLYDGYLGSFSDSTFNPDSRIVLGVFNTSGAAVQFEIQWQRVFTVVPDPEFVNRSYQTSTKFDTTGFKFDEDFKRDRSLKYSGEGNPNFGKVTPDKVKEKIAESLTGRKASEETCVKLSESLRGNRNRKGKPQPQEAIERARQKNLGSKRTAETKERQRQAALKRWSDHRARKVKND